LFRFIHVSDTHLGRRPYGLPERERDFYEAWLWVVRKALEFRVDAVLHAGDMFDSSRPTPLAYIKAIEGLRVLEERGVKFLVAPGNHELPRAAGVGSPVRVLERVSSNVIAPQDPEKPYIVRLHNATVIVFSEWASHMLSSLDPRSTAGSEGPLVGLAHVTLCDAMSEAEGVPVQQCMRGPRKLMSNSVRQGYSYLALGDIHTPWARLGVKPPMAYPGSTEYIAIDEYIRNNSRYVYLVEVDGNEVSRFERIRIEVVRPWIVVEGDYNTVKSSIEGVKRGPGKEPILYARVKSPLDQARRRALLSLLERLRGEGRILHYILDVEDKSAVGERRVVGPPRQVSVEAILEELVGKCGESARSKAVRALLELISNPEAAPRFVDELGRDQELLDCLERVLRG